MRSRDHRVKFFSCPKFNIVHSVHDTGPKRCRNHDHAKATESSYLPKKTKKIEYFLRSFHGTSTKCRISAKDRYWLIKDQSIPNKYRSSYLSVLYGGIRSVGFDQYFSWTGIVTLPPSRCGWAIPRYIVNNLNNLNNFYLCFWEFSRVLVVFWG